MQQYQVPKQEFMKHYVVRESGLTSKEAQENLKKNGFNELTQVVKKSMFQIFLSQFKDFLVIILMAAAIVAGVLGDVESTLVILAVITMNAILGTVQHLKAEKSMDSLKTLSAPVAKVQREGEIIEIPSREVTIGDIVLLEAGDCVCADGRIIENASLKINESMLTGESFPVDKEDIDLAQDLPIGDRINMVYSGSFVTYGRGKFLVTDIGMQTEIGKIATLIRSASEKKTPLQENLDDFGRKLSLIILGLCAILFVISVVRGDSLMNAFMFAVALAVAAIPEALSSIVTIVLSFGTQKLAGENAIIRHLQAVEGLGSVSIICSDKTGTLTQNKMTVKRYYVNHQMVNSSIFDLKDKQQYKLLLYGMLCNDSSYKEEHEIGDPTEIALLRIAEDYHCNVEEIRSQYPRLREIPFDSDRKLMSTLYYINHKYVMITKGAVDVLTSRLNSVETESGTIPFTHQESQKIEEANQNMSGSGLRVLAFAYKVFDEDKEITIEDEDNYTFLGLTAMMDPPREESEAAVMECIKAGIKPVMITGDHLVTASAIAKQIGILKHDNEAIEGHAIDKMSDEELESLVPGISVYARVSPEHKIRIVRAWQKLGNIVAMTGDGVNDAPALKQADIGVAMGITGSDVAKDAASMILTDDNFATIIKAVENGRNVYKNIKNAIKFLLSGNAAGILAVLYASLMGLTLPFEAVHLLFINLLTDSLPAIALGLEPHTKSVMDNKPRAKNDAILTTKFMSDILIEGIIIAIATMGAYYFGLITIGSAGAKTMAFAVLCLSRLLHGFNCKTKNPILFTKRMWNNKSLIYAFITGFVLLNAVLLIKPLHSIFRVVWIGNMNLLMIYGISLISLLVIQIIKWLRQRRTKLQKEKDLVDKLA